jgi:hypothetical protein
MIPFDSVIRRMLGTDMPSAGAIIMSHTREAEIRDNFAYFERVVGSLMAVHAGQYVLLHSRTVVEYFRTAADAVNAGVARFGEMPFSVQHVIDRPIDLGFLSHAADNGNALSR